MQFDMDLDTGTVTAKFTLAEFQKFTAALNGEPAVAPAPRVWELDVDSESSENRYYKTIIWIEADGNRRGYCPCGDHVYRKRWCKHLDYSNRVRVSRLVVTPS